MIIVKLQGGLGNQLFQYAAARHLSQLREKSFKMDLSFLNADPLGAYTKRSYELAVFNIGGNIAGEAEIRDFHRTGGSRFKRSLHRYFPYVFSRRYGKEYGFGFQPSFMDFPKDTYLDGFWQSEKYFKGSEALIRKELTFKPSLRGANKELAERILSCESVGVHVRRQDFMATPQVLAHHGVCSPEYYLQAIKIIASKCASPQLFFFSDDLEWVKTNIKPELPIIFVDHNKGTQSYEDMRLMSLCRHNIIANSSFSWWGAWLNAHPSKLVIAPKRWFNDTSIDSKDVIPSSWLSL